LFKFLFIKPEIKIDKTKIIRFITYLTLGNLSGVFFSYVDTILLGIFVTAEYVGYYRASSNLVLAIAGLLSFIYVFLPILAVAHDKKLNYLFNKIIKYSFIITIPAAFGLMAIAKYAIVLIYGYPYLKAFSTLYFLSPVIVLMVNTSLFLILFSAKEKTKEFAKLNLFITILNIILNLVFISILVKSSQVWAISGAAAAIMLSWMIYYLLASIIAKRKLGVSVRFSSFFKPFIASIVMFMAISFFNSLVSDMNIFYGIATVVIGMLVYALILLLIKGIAKEDFYLLKNLIKS
jgi:O-antigen/teichoic acid export membrane protein